MSVEPSKESSTRVRIASTLALIAIFFLAAALRLNNLDWDRGQHLHPDERYMTYLATLLQRPTNLSAYFNSATSPLNPMNTDWGASYVYGTLPLFTVRFFAEVLNKLGNTFLYTSYDGMAIAGRVASAIEDLITLAAVFLMARRLFGTRTGLLAALFGALTVLNIQQAHFFTVDSMATMFVALCVAACIWVTSLRPDKPNHTKKLFVLMALAGIFAGCAIASKISVWPLVPLIMLAAGVAIWRWAGWLDDARAVGTLIAALVIAGATTFLAFRIAQPYSFVGNSETEYFNTVRDCALYASGNTMMKVCDLAARLPEPLRVLVAPSSRWIQQLVLAQMFVSGTVDAPFGIQWANRQPIVFPLVNFVFYGAGIGLALAAIAGYAYAFRQLINRHRAWRYVILVAWVGAYFVYQSTQWTKSIRYLFPIYPLVCILAAHGLMTLWHHKDFVSASQARALRFVAPVLMALALGLHGAWAIAFSNMYNQPMARLQASDWIYANVPSAVTLQTSAGDVQLPEKLVHIGQNNFATIPIRQTDMPKTDETLSEVKLRLNHVAGEGATHASLRDLNTSALLAEANGTVSDKQLTLNFGAAQLNPHRAYYVEIEAATAETSITATTSVVAWEHWDDPMPLNTDGKAPALYYNGLTTSKSGQMENYNEDTPEKQAALINWLDEADALILSSNRLYASIPRLPYRYPLTVEYYRALFAGELGFDLALDSYLFPHLGPLQFNDQEMPFELNTTPKNGDVYVPYPTAEEAFSVYDHPRVLVFTKNASYTRENTLRVLGKIDVYGAVKQSPTEAVNTPNGMLFTPAQKAAQQTGLTWSQMFPADSPLNQSQPLAVLGLFALIEILGLAAFPMLALATRGKLAGGGFGFSKALGLLLVAVAVWLMASAQVLAFSASAVWLVMALLVIAGVFLWMRHRATLFPLLKQNRAAVGMSELVFLAAFGVWLFVRAGNPDLWHPYMGGEKPMDYAYLNAILRSAYFPPVDPWFSGGYINYYYFGLVIVAAPIKALGIDPAIAYNIAIPMLFALTASGAFVLGSTLTRSNGQPFKRSNILAGLLAALFVVGIGNLQEIRVMGGAWATLGGIGNGVNALEATVRGFSQWLRGAALPIYPMTPYWDATRIDPSVPIAEFPLFTFLYADLHAHMLAMPFVLLAFGLAIAYADGAVNWRSILLGSLVVGALYPTNSWDYPTLLLLCLAGIVIGVWSHPTASESRAYSVTQDELLPRPYLKIGLAVVSFALLTRAWFAPFYANFGQAYNSVDLWNQDHTPLDVYAKIHAIFLVPIGMYLLSGAWRTLNVLAETRQHRWIIFGVGLGALAMALGGALAALGIPIALVTVPIAAAALLAAISPGTAPSRRLMWLAAAGAITLTLAVEVIALKGDIGRMNTVFKFYVQVWLLMGVIAAPVSLWLMARHKWTSTLVVALVLGGLVYPAFAIPAKINDRISETAPRGLNGEVYMQTAQRTESGHPPAQPENTFALASDYEAIQWLRQNVKGSPTIIEGTTNPDLYRWGNRMSIYTGLPSVMGWWWHQNQQRASLPYSIVADRERDVADFYSTNDPEQAKQIALRYDARYVILGDLEKTYYPSTGLLKFEALVHGGFLRVAFANAGTTIYEVIQK